MKLTDLLEAERKTDTKTKKGLSDEDFLNDLFGDQPDQPIVHKKYAKDDDKTDDDDAPAKKTKTVSKEKTHAASANIRMDDRSARHLDDLHRNMPDAGAEEDEPKTPSTELTVKSAQVPKVVSHAMVAAGMLDPDFHIVANLPGNMSRAIQQLGKALFKELTSTPTKDISMVANLSGQGPNSEKEVNAVAAYAKKHGKDLGKGDVDFEGIMPGYKADTHMYTADGVRFMLVKDHAGTYIYAWPEKDSKLHMGHEKIAHDKPKADEPKRLK